MAAEILSEEFEPVVLEKNAFEKWQNLNNIWTFSQFRPDNNIPEKGTEDEIVQHKRLSRAAIFSFKGKNK